MNNFIFIEIQIKDCVTNTYNIFYSKHINTYYKYV